MKKCFYLLTALLCFSFIYTSCDDNDEVNNYDISYAFRNVVLEYPDGRKQDCLVAFDNYHYYDENGKYLSWYFMEFSETNEDSNIAQISGEFKVISYSSEEIENGHITKIVVEISNDGGYALFGDDGEIDETSGVITSRMDTIIPLKYTLYKSFFYDQFVIVEEGDSIRSFDSQYGIKLYTKPGL